MPRKKNPNGAGSIWRRKDGRYEARVYVPQPDGTRKRKTVYGASWEECGEKRQELVSRDRKGLPTPTRSNKLAEWLPYWLEEFIRPQRKKTTYAKYETHVRRYLIPSLGAKRLESLSVPEVRRFLAAVTRQASAATAKESHRVLRTALSAACREELISRNVATLVPAPRVEVREMKTWTLDETITFLEAARPDSLYTAFVLAIALGLRRGEILGLRWSDIDLDRRTLTVRNQLQRVQKELYADSTKNRRTRVIPLPLMCIAPLRWRRLQQAKQRAASGGSWEATEYVFTTRTGRPIEPRNLSRSFERVAAEASLPRIRPHDPARLRHPSLRRRRRPSGGHGDPGALADRRDHEHLHARLRQHSTGGHESHGPDAQAESSGSLKAPSAYRHQCRTPCGPASGRLAWRIFR